MDEDEGVGDVLVGDTLEEVLVVDGEAVLKLMLTTVVGSRDAVVVVTVAVVGDADAVDSGSLSYIAASTSRVSFESGK